MNTLIPERFMTDDTLIENDYDIMKRLAPEKASLLYDIIEDTCDRMEYQGSFLYDESPDKTTFLNLTEKITEHVTGVEAPTVKDLIQLMLCDEIRYRRCRYYRKKKMFE